ncbi:MAG: winged helix-turn-helix transcriptional regulator [Clostridia bacterium]|nr:winged helix-turn-helix transcriptional regulator [Clostridia bacterium]
MKERFETFTVLIAKISRNIRKIKNHEMAEYDLRSPHVSCLYYLYSSDSLTAAELCERCEEDKATISRSLDHLKKNGFLENGTVGSKRYKTPLVLTDKGKEVGKKISDKINSVLDEISRDLSEKERVEFYRSLSVVSDGLDTICSRLEEKSTRNASNTIA